MRPLTPIQMSDSILKRRDNFFCFGPLLMPHQLSGMQCVDSLELQQVNKYVNGKLTTLQQVFEMLNSPLCFGKPSLPVVFICELLGKSLPLIVTQASICHGSLPLGFQSQQNLQIQLKSRLK